MSNEYPDDNRSPSDPIEDPSGTDPVDSRSTETASVSTQGRSTREAAALRRARTISKILDEAVRVPGTGFKVGLDPVVGVLPVAGDAVATAISLYPIAEAYRFGASKSTLTKMLALVAVDSVIGSIPLVGPVFDAFWKANKWNLRTLEHQITQR